MNYKIALIPITAALILSACTTTKKTEVTSPQELLRQGMIESAKGKFMSPNDINEIDEQGNTVLHIAAQLNDDALVTYFIIKGADLEIKNLDGDTPLHVAIKNDSFEAAKQLIAFGANIFARDSENISAIDSALATDPAYYDVFITPKTGEIRDMEGKSIVHYFVQRGNIDGVKHCIKKGIPVSVPDNYDKTPLDYAVENINDIDSVYIAAELILNGAEVKNSDFTYFQDAITNRNLNLRLDDGQTPLHLSAISGHSAIAKYLLENGTSTESQDSTGSTPLHEAIRYGHIDIAKMILDAGANINAKDNLGKTPIMLIPPKEKIAEIYNLLIAYKADLLQKDMYGDTVLHTSVLRGVTPAILSTLINGGADVNAKNKEGVTAFEIAVQKQNIDHIKCLAEAGSDIHSKDSAGNSPLMLALDCSNEVFDAVITSKNVLTQDSEGNTPLHIALLNDSNLAKIQYIASLTDDVNTRNRDGNSALYIAVLKNRQKAGELLIEKNADIFSSNINNDSPLRMALKEGGSLQDWLITSSTIKSTDGSGNTVLHYAAEWQYADSISALLTKGADISAKNANGETPLFSAAKTNNPQIIQMIIDGGASVKVRDNLGSTPIHTAVRWDAVDSIGKLIDSGIDVNNSNTAGKTPLAEAVLAGKAELTEYLLNHGANINSCDSNGVTVLMDAVKGQNISIIRLLLKHDANPNMQDINGRNAYHEAALTLNKDIISVIREAGGNPLGRDKQGNTPLSFVINEKTDIILEVLGDNKNIVDSDGNTPMHIAVKSKNPSSLIKTLISNGYPVDIRNSEGYTPLAYAIEAKDNQKAVVLLENGANPFQMIDKKGKNGVSIALENKNKTLIGNIVKYAGNKYDIQGNTILHYAAKVSSSDIIKLLLSYGIDKNAKNASGDTAYTIATRWKRSDIAALLATK